MKRLLLIFLMLLLPAQYTWSAAAVYCQHEQRATSHFGHHAHQHQDKAGEPDGHGKVANDDPDCEYCHLFSHAFFVPFDTRPAAPAAVQAVAARLAAYSSYIPRRPPRPNWSRVA